MRRLFNKFSTGIFYFTILLFIIAFNFSDNPPGGWHQQFLPNLNGQPLSDMVFLDSLNGFAVTNNDAPKDTGYIIRTTNGGNDWNIILKDIRDFTRIFFINSNTGFVCGGSGGGTPFLYKTTNSGINWFIINSPFTAFWQDMSVLNEDTIWLADSDGLVGGVYRTTNGGASWTRQITVGARNIYMINARIGFFERLNDLWKTTNSGVNWVNISNNPRGFSDMYFIDSLTGWKCSGPMRKTTDGGLTWITQTLPSGGFISSSEIINFTNINKDTIWGVGAEAFYGQGRSRALIYKTTNGGITWGYQQPDTSIQIGQYNFVNFANKNTGWAYSYFSGVKTTSGGKDTTIYTGIKESFNNLLDKFKLCQNYPNPFNPNTVISYRLAVSSFANLKVFDMAGKEIKELINQKQRAGDYKIEFNGKELASGIYFYSLYLNGNLVDTKTMILIK